MANEAPRCQAFVGVVALHALAPFSFEDHHKATLLKIKRKKI
jgi:hypothetical protein